MYKDKAHKNTNTHTHTHKQRAVEEEEEAAAAEQIYYTQSSFSTPSKPFQSSLSSP